jgi:hypothetical protein
MAEVERVTGCEIAGGLEANLLGYVETQPKLQYQWILINHIVSYWVGCRIAGNGDSLRKVSTSHEFDTEHHSPMLPLFPVHKLHDIYRTPVSRTIEVVKSEVSSPRSSAC